MPGLAANQALIAIGRTGAQLFGNIASILWLAIGGAIGLATGNIMLLVAIVGTVEVPNLACFLWSLRRDNLIDWREEAYGPAMAVAGVLVGMGLSWVGLHLIAHI